MIVALLCCVRSGRVVRSKRGLPILPPCPIGMEACVGAHHLSRKLKALGHDARLMPAKYVRPYSKGQKNDFGDAEAIAEAVRRPTMKFVATKTAVDLCCGQGNAAEALVGRRCHVVGIDFSPAMLTLARHRVPTSTFFEGDAQDLPFTDAEFDIVVSNVGVCHVPDQPRALSEIRRVLRPQGRFAMTVWCGPDVSQCFEVVYGAVKAHGSPNVSVPLGPDFHQFAKREIVEELLSKVGFSNIELSIINSGWDVSTPESLGEIIERGTVRAAALFANQPAQNFAAIRSTLTKATRERFASGNRWHVPVPAALVSATA